MDEPVVTRSNRAQLSTGAPAWLRALLSTLSPAGSRGRLAILLFHRVHPQPDELFPNEMHAEVFSDLMAWIKSAFSVLPLSEATGALARGALPSRALAITFDDGYADNATVALPILRRLGMPATFFVATGFVDGGRMFNDSVIEAIRRFPESSLDLSEMGLGVYRTTSPRERQLAIATLLQRLKYLPSDERKANADAIARLCRVPADPELMMTSNQVRELAGAGMELGAHTVSHPILASLDHTAARHEIGDARDVLEAIVRGPVKLFAYPNGKPDVDYGIEHVRIARRLGFSAAVSTAAGAACARDSLFELPRFTPWDRTTTKWGVRLARNYLRRIATATR